jgi:hypothetical protein
MNALHALLTSPTVQAFGPEPAITIMRVPHSENDFTAARIAFMNALPKLKAQGFVPSEAGPNPTAGTYDVSFSSAPQAMTAASATTQLQASASPLIRVTSITAPQMVSCANREHDFPAYYGSDLVRNPNGTFCTAGFTVIGTLGDARGTTADHCGEVTGSSYYTNGGYSVTAPSKQGRSQVYGDGTTINQYGQTSNHAYGGDADIQFFWIPGVTNNYGAYIWDGTGTSQPTAKPVGNPYTSYPMTGDFLTVDGAISRMVRYVYVQQAGPNTCFPANGICGVIMMNGYGGSADWPVEQEGDSGGPVFCYACYADGKVKPAGLIEGGPIDPNPNLPVYATLIGNDLAAIPGSHIKTAP